MSFHKILTGKRREKGNEHVLVYIFPFNFDALTVPLSTKFIMDMHQAVGAGSGPRVGFRCIYGAADAGSPHIYGQGPAAENDAPAGYACWLGFVKNRRRTGSCRANIWKRPRNYWRH